MKTRITLAYCIAILLCFFALGTAHAQRVAADAALTDLAYSVQADNSVFFTGRQQGRPVHLMHRGAIGAGKWFLFTGTEGDRVRLLFDDKKGLQEILAVDKGQRITLNQVQQERVEYRLYAPDRSFIMGAVLYRSNGRWLQGLLKTEDFRGYAGLVEVVDVSSKLARLESPGGTPFARALLQWWQAVHLVSTANAQTTDDFLARYLGESAQDARNFFAPVANEMAKGMLVGAAAFTVQLAGATLTAGETVAIGGALVAAGPLLVAVGTGVAVGLAADRVSNWVSARPLGNGNGITELYNRLVAATRYTEERSGTAGNTSVAGASNSANAAGNAAARKASAANLLDMADKMDRLDRQDLLASLEVADACTRRRDFACTEEQLAAATKAAGGSADRQLIASARQNMAQQKSRMAEELRQREAAAALAKAKALAQAQEEERRAKAQQAQAESSGGFQFQKFAALGIGGLIVGDKLSGEAQVKLLQGMFQDSMEGQSGTSNTMAALGSGGSGGGTSQASGAGQSAKPTASGASGRSAESWHDDYSNRVTATGVVKSYPNHDTGISGDLMASKMGSLAGAKAMWSGQGGTITEYSGCGACGVGSTVRVIVNFGHIVDTHIYVRDR